MSTASSLPPGNYRAGIYWKHQGLDRHRWLDVLRLYRRLRQQMGLDRRSANLFAMGYAEGLSLSSGGRGVMFTTIYPKQRPTWIGCRVCGRTYDPGRHIHACLGPRRGQVR